MLSILRAEEEYWRRRGGIKWVTKGDANTGYFHAFANGRKRKGSILRLNHGDRVLITQAEICNHIYDFLHLRLLSSFCSYKYCFSLEINTHLLKTIFFLLMPSFL